MTGACVRYCVYAPSSVRSPLLYNLCGRYTFSKESSRPLVQGTRGRYYDICVLLLLEGYGNALWQSVLSLYYRLPLGAASAIRKILYACALKRASRYIGDAGRNVKILDIGISECKRAEARDTARKLYRIYILLKAECGISDRSDVIGDLTARTSGYKL